MKIVKELLIKNLVQRNSDFSQKENDKNFKKKLKYNSVTNMFEEIKEKETKGTSEENENLNKIKESESEKKKLEIYKNFLYQKCLLSEKEKYVCNYISNIISKNKINVKIGKTENIANVIKENCMHTMKNVSLCNQILVKIEPIIENLKLITSISSPLNKLEENKGGKVENTQKSEADKSNNSNDGSNKMKVKRDINLLIASCNFEFLPLLLKNRKICLNNILIKELENRGFDLNDNCVKEFCLNCCFVNYGNNQCKICEKTK